MLHSNLGLRSTYNIFPVVFAYLFSSYPWKHLSLKIRQML